MRNCVSCGDLIPENKRKDARYCGKSKCRGREYRKRRQGAVTANAVNHGHHSSTILSCPCGRRYLLAVTPLCAGDHTAAPELLLASRVPETFTQTDSLTRPAVPTITPEGIATNQAAVDLTQTVLRQEPQSSKPGLMPAGTSPQLEAFTKTVLPTEARSTETSATSGPSQDAIAMVDGVAATEL